MKRFGGEVDWSGHEKVRANLWHRQLHIFLHPFYYVEYGIAQLGALQVCFLLVGKMSQQVATDGVAAPLIVQRGIQLGAQSPQNNSTIDHLAARHRHAPVLETQIVKGLLTRYDLRGHCEDFVVGWGNRDGRNPRCANRIEAHQSAVGSDARQHAVESDHSGDPIYAYVGLVEQLPHTTSFNLRLQSS